MKIVQSVEKLYYSKYDFYKILKDIVCQSVLARKKATWHFVDRIKSIESFALKLETGRFSLETIFEDFFACTLVVENLNAISDAVELVESIFSIKDRKPSSSSFTFKQSDSFIFDDLRLYCTLDDNQFPEKSFDITNLRFEIQIKTFLQHAWSIATHDLIYKTNSISWGRERIAYQVKAALEQAEVAISGAHQLSKVNELSKENSLVRKINKVISILIKTFNPDDLPDDKRRLAQNVLSFIDAIDLSINELDKIICSEKVANRGPHYRNLSPFQIIVTSVYSQKPDLLLKFLRKKRRSNYVLLVNSEMDILPIRRILKHNIIHL